MGVSLKRAKNNKSNNYVFSSNQVNNIPIILLHKSQSSASSNKIAIICTALYHAFND